jgi:hypothetical protein
MKLKDLAPVLRSSTGAMQEAVVYDLDSNQDLASGCSVDYAVKHYGDMELDRITAYGHSLVLSVREALDEYPLCEPMKITRTGERHVSARYLALHGEL